MLDIGHFLSRECLRSRVGIGAIRTRLLHEPARRTEGGRLKRRAGKSQRRSAMKRFGIVVTAAVVFALVGANAGGQNVDPKTEAKGTLTLGDKTYKFTRAL